MTDEERVMIKRFLQTVTECPRLIHAQPHRREGVFLWCEDWEIIEIAKCLLHGEAGYLGDPPPRRLRHNPLWDQRQIVTQTQELQQRLGTIPAILDHLRTRRNGAH